MGTNRLSLAASAYLRSAAHQPVDWFPWGPEPFAAAAAADRPVLLDIGAVWCHWCHVMDGESYEDPGLADFLNQHFVCVKVDRDERPDVDARFQRAVQAVARQGGWPLTGFLTPEAELFFGGTYFPPRSMHGRPSFREILDRVLAVWRTERGNVLAQARALREALGQHLDETGPGEMNDLLLSDATHRILAAADRSHGGFGSRPKFPHPATVSFLLHRWCDTADPTIRSVIHETLDGMANGGFRDLVGGGFHRYSVDERWIIPHFEKMSSDNAELLRVYAEAAALFGKESWRDVVRETAAWVAEVLEDAEGGFGASQDADTGPEDDGDYFTWTEPELAGCLTADELPVALSRFGIGTLGSMPHAVDRNVLFQTDAASSANLATIRAKLRTARSKRTAPFVDRTRYANWNALLAAALLRAGPVLGDDRLTRSGLAALTRLRREQAEPDAIAHTASGVIGLLDDPVQSAAAALDAFETTGELPWLEWSAGLMDRVWRAHWDTDRGGLLDVARDRGGEGLLGAPAKPIQDSPNASPNGVAGIVFARLFEHTRDRRWRERHQALVAAFAAASQELGLFASAYLVAANWLVRPATHLVITGGLDPLAEELHRLALLAFVPRRVVIRVRPGADLDRLPPSLRALVPAAAAPRGIACAGNRCLAPTSDPAEWRTRLRSLVPPGTARE